MLTDDEGFYLKGPTSQRAPGIYLAQVTWCRPRSPKVERPLAVSWRLQIVAPTFEPGPLRWRNVITGMEAFEDLREMLALLGVALGHVDEIPRACDRASGRLVFIQVMPSGAIRLLHKANEIRRFPPFWERMRLAEAVLKCKGFGLAAFIKQLKRYTFLDERQPGDAVQARFLRPFAAKPRNKYQRRSSAES